MTFKPLLYPKNNHIYLINTLQNQFHLKSEANNLQNNNAVYRFIIKYIVTITSGLLLGSLRNCLVLQSRN